MSLTRFQVTFPTDSAIPADYVTNTFHFFNATPVIPVTDYDNVRDILKDFYTTSPGSGNALTTYLSAQLNGPAMVKAYNLSDPIPRAPVYESTFAFTPSGTAALPSEVALVLSFQAVRASGESQARRRNRIYLGPLGTNCNSAGRPDGVFIGQVQKAAKKMLNAAESSVTWDWVVWSETSGDWHDVEDGWVDNAWDTQRRRGVAASSRVVWNPDFPV